MKYRSIRGVAHNFVHSFMSWPNQINDVPVCEELYRILRDRPSASIVIDWLAKGASEATEIPERVSAAIERQRSILPQFLARHSIRPGALVDFKMRIYCDATHQIHVEMRLADDHGRAFRRITRV